MGSFRGDPNLSATSAFPLWGRTVADIADYAAHGVFSVSVLMEVLFIGGFRAVIRCDGNRRKNTIFGFEFLILN